MQKKVLGFVPAPQGHWMGDGVAGLGQYADAGA